MKKKHLVNTGLYAIIIILAIIAVFPFLWILLSSFKSANELANSPLTLIPKEFTIEYYKQVLFDLGFVTNIRNSLIVSLAATLITIIVSALGAYGIVRFFPRFGKLMTKMLIATYMFPPILLAIPYTIVKIGRAHV